ncbi:MAG: amidohydrolase family protein, partial [Bryobacteraceae bacterium]
MDSPWGTLWVSDAHVHFFSHKFFAALARQKGVPVEEAAALLGWQTPPPEPEKLADHWAHELDRCGVKSAALIASMPGDEESVAAAVKRQPGRFYGYFMLN